MKIVHLCLSCFYIDGYAYQENQLVAQHVADGHDVTVIASTESFDNLKQHCYTTPSDYCGSDGARVIRLAYRKIGPHRLAAKFRAYPNVRKLLIELQPDVILFHGLCAWEMLTVASHARRHPQVLMYADCHENFNNSARTFASKWLLHFGFYRQIIRHCLPAIRKVLCVSQESINFAQKMYGIAPEQVEFYPLGGNVFDDESYTAVRHAKRAEYGWNEQTIVFVQSGKIDRSKKLVDSLSAFTSLHGSNFRFVIAGKIMSDIESEVNAFKALDSRIQDLGWVEPTQLHELLCSADVYVQPGTQSATMQMSLCCRCAVVLDDVISHRLLFDDNGFLVRDATGLSEAFIKLSQMPRQNITVMGQRSLGVASKLLDYKQLSRRILK
jgi:1,2-diacylglycerol 3-alpha-glucosyltransferase